MFSETCDNCSEQMSTAERYICIPCSSGDVSAYDDFELCTDCMDDPTCWIDDITEGNAEHRLSHNLLQIRFPVPQHFVHFARSKGEACLVQVTQSESEVPRTCVTCNGDIAEPYWCCVDCTGASIGSRH